MIDGDFSARVEDIIRSVASSTIMPRFRSLRKRDVIEKSPGDFVTVADREAEEKLSDALMSLLDGSVVVGEESVSADERLLGLLDSESPVWLIDPIDGTGNFVNGSDSFGVMVALLHGGVTLGSWIWLPVHELMYTAVKGQGAFRNNTPLSDEPATKIPSQMSGTIKRKYLPAELNAQVSATAAGFAGIDVGQYCAAVEYAGLAERTNDFILYGRVLPWDHIPGALLVEETGGAVCWFDGDPYSHRLNGFGILAVADRPNWEPVAKVMFKQPIR